MGDFVDEIDGEEEMETHDLIRFSILTKRSQTCRCGVKVGMKTNLMVVLLVRVQRGLDNRVITMRGTRFIIIHPDGLEFNLKGI